jgi:hypothetical protein
MHAGVGIAGCLIIGTVLWDAFETIAVPRTATTKLGLTRTLYRSTWRLWAAVARSLGSDHGRERLLGLYGPSSLFGLLAVWTGGLVIGFALLLGSQHSVVSPLPADTVVFDLLYLSGSTLFTLGLGDVTANNRIGRALIVAEAGIGLGLLTLVLSYLPVLYGSFARRETRLTLLDTWAGSPPAAVEVLQRLAATGDRVAFDEFLKEWEYWCSEVLESHLSYPAVAYFRSQHQRQSWISALATVLDVCALLKVGVDGQNPWRAHATFAVARHAAVDLAQILGAPLDLAVDRLRPDELAALQRDLEQSGGALQLSCEAVQALAELRRSYEPYIAAISRRLILPMPPWRHSTPVRHNWLTNPRREGGAHF